jgi:hypothetical protein
MDNRGVFCYEEGGVAGGLFPLRTELAPSDIPRAERRALQSILASTMPNSVDCMYAGIASKSVYR